MRRRSEHGAQRPETCLLPRLARRGGLVVLCLVLAGRAGQVDPEPRTVRVEVPVAVPCRAPEVQEPT